ncbi:MAG: hypothetical protein JSR66_15150 [Proteobacteria bacterium]|nr:hypothetical protein [Pseudomonadota bacterium]
MSMISARMGSATVISLTLVGCGSVGVALGTRTRLDQLPVTGLSATLAPQPSLTPGKSGRLVIVASAADGKTWTTVGAGHGTVLFDSFKLESTVANINSNGYVWLPADPRVSSGKSARVHITVVGHPDIQVDLDVPVKYNVPFAAHFSGASGNPGISGMDGLAGTDGTAGSLNWNNPVAGGSGGNGSNGSDGGNGFPGQTVHVWVTLQPGPEHLIEVRAQGSGKREDFFLVDPDGGSLTIDANGGEGGNGGMGGRGGRGGSGGTGAPNGVSGNAGMDGSDGRPGAEGPPGRIFVTIDPAADTYRNKLHFSTHGNGRAGPAAEFHTEPVSPLW